MKQLWMFFKKKLFNSSSISPYNKTSVKNIKIYSINKHIFFFILIIILSVIFIVYFNFTDKSIIVSYAFINIYTIYLLLFFYPSERKKMIRYINKVLKDKKEEYVKELENIRNNSNKKEITKLILKDIENFDIDFWNIKDKTNILIGKNSNEVKVDIDFSNHEYSYLVSRIHAILNKVDDSWYFEDLESKNGSGIEKLNGIKEKLIPLVPYKLELGDIICIGAIRILVN